MGDLLAVRKGGGGSSAARSSLVAAMADGGGFLDFGAPEGGGPEGAAGVGRPEGAPAGGRAGWRGQPAAGTAGGRGRRRQGGRSLAGVSSPPIRSNREARVFFPLSFFYLGNMSKEKSRGSMVIFIAQTPHVRPLLPLTTNRTWTEGYRGKKN